MATTSRTQTDARTCEGGQGGGCQVLQRVSFGGGSEACTPRQWASELIAQPGRALLPCFRVAPVTGYGYALPSMSHQPDRVIPALGRTSRPPGARHPRATCTWPRLPAAKPSCAFGSWTPGSSAWRPPRAPPRPPAMTPSAPRPRRGRQTWRGLSAGAGIKETRGFDGTGRRAVAGSLRAVCAQKPQAGTLEASRGRITSGAHDPAVGGHAQ